MADGRADLWINPAALGHPKISELSQTTAISFLDLDLDKIEKLESAGLSAAMLPANSFKGQTTSEKTVAAFDPARAWQPGVLGGVPLHPDAARYFEEAGLKQ